MKKLVTLATLAFLAAIAGTHLMAARTPSEAAPGESVHTLAEIARHADARSCWMAIDGVVYDFTAYLPAHPAAPSVMARYCGREASDAFRTKDAGRPHSDHARDLLGRYRIGVLARRP